MKKVYRQPTWFSGMPDLCFSKGCLLEMGNVIHCWMCGETVCKGWSVHHCRHDHSGKKLHQVISTVQGEDVWIVFGRTERGASEILLRMRSIINLEDKVQYII